MFLVDLEILASHPIEEYAAFLEFIFIKVIVIVNCLEIQPLSGNFLRILNITQSTNGRLRLPPSSISRELPAALSTPRKASGVRERKGVQLAHGMMNPVCVLFRMRVPRHFILL